MFTKMTLYKADLYKLGQFGLMQEGIFRKHFDNKAKGFKLANKEKE